MIEQVMALLQGKQQFLVLIYFFCLDVSALTLMLRIVLSKLLQFAERATVLEPESCRQIREKVQFSALTMLLFLVAHAVIFYWGYCHFPFEAFVGITLAIVFLCYGFLAAPVVFVVILAFKKRIDNCDVTDNVKKIRLRDEIAVACNSVANIVRAGSYFIIMLSLILILLHMQAHDLLVNLQKS